MASEGSPLIADPEARTDLAAGAAREERPGLTDDYTSWSSSRQARRAAALHFSLYLFLAVVGFSFVVERWTVLDSLYFAVVLFTTVGASSGAAALASRAAPSRRAARPGRGLRCRERIL